jgi:F0F1-type ATP synthase membrane subunit b/b'
MELTSDIRTQGITVNQFKNNLSGDISVRLNKGRIRNAKILSNVTQALPKVIQPFMPNLEDFSLSRILNVKLTIKQGKIHFTDLAIPLRELDLLAYGNIGLDNSIDMKMDIALNRNTSQRILAQQRRLQKAAGGLLGKANIGGKLGDAIKGKVGSMIDKVQLIPSDKQGRVVPIVGAKGQLNKIEYYLVGFKGATDDTSASDDGKPIGEQAKKMLKDQVDKAKARAKQELDKAKARAKQELDKAKARAKQELDKAKDKVEKAAAEVKDKAAAAAAKAREEAEKRKRELEKKAKDAADQAKKKAQDALKFKSPF